MLEAITHLRWYLGVVRVYFLGLNFDHAITSISYRSYNKKNIKRLENVFKIQGGCDKLNKEYFISITVDVEDLKYSLEISSYLIKSLSFNVLATPYLNNVKVNYLYSLYRIKAASRVLD